MENNTIVMKLRDCGVTVETNVNLAAYTSFKIGGCADFLAKPQTVGQVICIVKAAKEANVDYYFLGNGSNLLVCDEGYRGMVILTTALSDIRLAGESSIQCDAGATVSKLCNFAYANSLTGLEFAYGIPGSVGGGIYMNAGAYGGEFKNVLQSCCYLDEQGNEKEITIDEMDMSYRHSFFSDKKLFILSALFQLEPAERTLIKEKMEDYLFRRKSKQPLEYPSCGSTFKRPPNGYASALIEECGLKGVRIGGAEVSVKHAGFVINRGNATCKDVLSLVEHIKKVVYEKKGIQLECEVKTLGCKPMSST